MKRPSRRAPGFTLIEVLVALAIVAIGMAAVLSTLTSSASTVIYMKDRTLAQWIAGFARSAAPAFVVMIRITLRKSTVLPLWSVSFP